MPLQFVAGDLFANRYGVQAFAHGCNCQGSMGAGIAKTFRANYPAMYAAYRERCRAQPPVQPWRRVAVARGRPAVGVQPWHPGTLQRLACVSQSDWSSDDTDQEWECSLLETPYPYLRYLAGGMPTSRLKALRKATPDS